MSISKPQLIHSLIAEQSGSAADRDAATVLDPDSYIDGVPYAALARLRRDAPVHPVQLPGLPKAWLLTKQAEVRQVSRDTETFNGIKSLPCSLGAAP